jgi:hypothetical protein
MRPKLRLTETAIPLTLWRKQGMITTKAGSV